jgi:NO-binding membrane sensor protein with MHYT domain
MWQFIVSGYIPGTDIQVTFEMFVTFVTAFLAVFLFWFTLRQISITQNKQSEQSVSPDYWTEIAL